MKWWLLLVAFLAGSVVGLFVRGSDNRIEALQAYADSVRRADSLEVAGALEFAAGERHRADSLQALRQRVRVVVRQDSADAVAAREAVATAQTLRDSATALVEHVAALEHQATAYAELSRLDSLTLVAERARGDSLLRVVGDLNEDIRGLTDRVAKLRPMPKWARYSLEVVKLGAVGYAGFKAGQASR